MVFSKKEDISGFTPIEWLATAIDGIIRLVPKKTEI